jgi:RNA polymerase sigma-70 factor (ECF subfamily)
VAFLVVLERLAPEERAAFLLHEVFDSEYADIARILGKSEAACRQIVHRARERVRRDRPRFEVSEAARVRLLERFVAALHAQDQEALLSLFAEDATWTSDGGGKTRAARKVVRSARFVVRFVQGVWQRYLSKTTLRVSTVNGEAGLLTFMDGRLSSVISIDTDGVRIRAVYIVLNPDKLRGIAADIDAS